jgi:hypothetical protein
MANLIYRVVSPCNLLGAGFPHESFTRALEGQVDAIVVDAGTVEFGPFLLGSGGDGFNWADVRYDLERVIAAAHRIGCRLIIGSSGVAGGDRNLAAFVQLGQEIFERLGIQKARVATISSELSPQTVVAEFRAGALRSLCNGITLSEDALQESIIVGQMGVHPIIAALETGAQYVIAGRACDASLFAADMIRRGIDYGLAYHVGQVLDGGAGACEPPAPSDCLVAEIYDDQSAFFVPPDPQRRCTVHSLAAFAMYTEGHPQLQFYPEGVLSTVSTQYHARDPRSAGLSDSRWLSGPTNSSIKVEGARRLGYRRISLLNVDPANVHDIPTDCLVYGRDAVQLAPYGDAACPMGILIETSAATQDSAASLGHALRLALAQFSYPGRKSTAGNLAFPLSPFGISFKRPDASFGFLIPCGTADPLFFRYLRRIEAAVIETIQTESPHVFAYASHSIQTIDATNPLVLVRTVDRDISRLTERHAAEIARVAAQADLRPGSRLNLDAPDAYEWSLFHVLEDERVIDELFPITHYEANGAAWTQSSVQRPVYTPPVQSGTGIDIDITTVSVIEDVEPQGCVLATQSLMDLASIIRTHNVGVGLLTFDLLFDSAESYESALRSNVFCRTNIAKTLALPLEHIVGSYFVDASNAIKITIDRPVVAGSALERDLFGVQQQTALQKVSISIHARVLAMSSSF